MLNLEQFEPILKECGLENYFLTMDLDMKLQKELKDWAPPTAFPSASLLVKLAGSPSSQDAKHSPDSMSEKLPPEILERVFSHLEAPDLRRCISLDRKIAAISLARLYHSIDIVRPWEAKPQVDILGCLRTLIECPHLASQVCTFNFKVFTPKSERQLFLDAKELLPKVATAIASTVHALGITISYEIDEIANMSGALIALSLEFPRLGFLTLSGDESEKNFPKQATGIRAPNLISLECGLEFALIVLPHLPALLSLQVRVTDEHPSANDTVKAFGLKHPKVRLLTLVIDWGVLVQGVQHHENRLLGVVADTDFPCVERLIFSVRSIRGENHSIKLMEYFILKTPNMTSMIVDWSLDSPLMLEIWKSICPRFVNCRMMEQYWIWDSITEAWKLWDHFKALTTIMTAMTRKEMVAGIRGGMTDSY